MWQVYILRCSDNTLYTGITKNIARRLNEHNNQQSCNYTRTRTPVALAHKEAYPTRSQALKREAYIKSLTKAKKLALINNT